MSEKRSSPYAGRAALGNVGSRFSNYQREAFDDGWIHEGPDLLRTELQIDSSRSIISYNRSPDIPFDRSVNPYRGCEHGCIYCYARPTHAWLGLSPGLDFESRLFYKPAAAQLLEREFARTDYEPATIVLGANTDPYQPLERRLKITRRILVVLSLIRQCRGGRLNDAEFGRRFTGTGPVAGILQRRVNLALKRLRMERQDAGWDLDSGHFRRPAVKGEQLSLF